MNSLDSSKCTYLVVEANTKDAEQPLVRAAFRRREEAEAFAASCVSVMGYGVERAWAAVVDSFGGAGAVRGGAVELARRNVDYLQRWIEAARTACGDDDIGVRRGEESLAEARAAMEALQA